MSRRVPPQIGGRRRGVAVVAVALALLVAPAAARAATSATVALSGVQQPGVEARAELLDPAAQLAAGRRVGDQVVQVAAIAIATNNPSGMTVTATAGGPGGASGYAVALETGPASQDAIAQRAAATDSVRHTGSGTTEIDLYLQVPAQGGAAGASTITLTMSDE